MKNNYLVIMAGGIGSRFWPFSRKSHPKQFQDILGTGKTLLQQTVERFDGLCAPENIYIATNEIYYTVIKEQLPFLNDEQILLEPVMRNTAPCIAYASHKIHAKNPNANIVVTPADHIILHTEKFQKTISYVLKQTAEHDILVTLGIEPSRPDTGYGYIQSSKKSLGKLHKVKTFTEKPELEMAKAFLESGDFVWNSGIFIWNVKTILKSFQQHLPDITSPFKELRKKYYTSEEQQAVKKAYYQCRNISIDYGIMETAEDVYVMPSNFGWSDLGTWKSLFELAEKDENDNVIQGKVLTYESNNCIIKTPDECLVVVQGLEDYIVAKHKNVLLICEKKNEQRIKQFVVDIKNDQGDEYIE